MPKALKPGQIKARLGSVAGSYLMYVAQFIEELLPGITMQVTYIPSLVRGPQPLHKRATCLLKTVQVRHEAYTGLELIEAGLDAQTPVVYDTVEDEQGNEKRILNQRGDDCSPGKAGRTERPGSTPGCGRMHALSILRDSITRVSASVRPHADGSPPDLPGLFAKLLIPARFKGRCLKFQPAARCSTRR